MSWQWVTLLLGLAFAFVGLIVFLAIISRDSQQRQANRRRLSREVEQQTTTDPYE